MSSLNPFRSLPIVLLKPDIWGRWLSALKSRRPSELLNPRSPEFLPAMATLVTNYTDDVKEGTAAFHEKRKPQFKGK